MLDYNGRSDTKGGGGMPEGMDGPFKFISILYRKSHVWLSSGCAGLQLTAAQAAVLLIVCDMKTPTQDDITKRLSLDKSVIAKTVTKLEEAGFLVRKTNARDKRTYDICPTQKAWQVYPAVQQQVDACFQRMTAQMTPAQRRTFRRLLEMAAQAALAQED